MAFIKPGIHGNCKFGAGSKINDKGTLVLDIEIGSTDVVAAFAGNDTLDTAKGGFMFFPPNTTDFEKNPYTIEEIADSLMKMRKMFLTYAALLAPKADAEAAFGGNALFEGIGVTAEQIPDLIARLDNEEVLKKVSTNLQTKFLAFMQAQPNFTTTEFRHKFWRKNKKESFAVIPMNQFDTYVESMDVPDEASAIIWSEWEIKNGKNNPNPVKADDTNDAPDDAQNLFGADAEKEDESTPIDSLI